VNDAVEWRARRYHDQFREHWAVYINGQLHDVSTSERDAELRSNSLCEVPAFTIHVRHAKPYRRVSAAGVASYGFRVNTMHVWPPHLPPGGPS